MSKIIIAGTRDFTNAKAIEAVLRENLFRAGKCRATEIVAGMCRGPDLIGYWWAKKCGIPVKEFPADWDNLGKRAGPVRNIEMAQYADEAIVFWDTFSRGTGHLLTVMKELEKPVELFTDVMKFRNGR